MIVFEYAVRRFVKLKDSEALRVKNLTSPIELEISEIHGKVLARGVLSFLPVLQIQDLIIGKLANGSVGAIAPVVAGVNHYYLYIARVLEGQNSLTLDEFFELEDKHGVAIGKDPSRSLNPDVVRMEKDDISKYLLPPGSAAESAQEIWAAINAPPSGVSKLS